MWSISNNISTIMNFIVFVWCRASLRSLSIIFAKFRSINISAKSSISFKFVIMILFFEMFLCKIFFSNTKSDALWSHFEKMMSSFLMNDKIDIVDWNVWMNSLNVQSVDTIVRHSNIWLLYLLLFNLYKLTIDLSSFCVVLYCWLNLNFELFDWDFFWLLCLFLEIFRFDKIFEILRFCIELKDLSNCV